MSETAPPPQSLPPHLRPWFYATKPTRWTRFWRTFLPWQLVRFAVINVKMMILIWRSHRGRKR